MTGTQFTVRAMQATDLPVCLSFTQAVKWPHRDIDWQLHYETGNGSVITGENDDIVGCILWWDYDNCATVGLVVVPDHMQGQGLGRRLMNTVMSQAGDRTLMLVATEAGKRLYEQCGFSVTDNVTQVQGTLTGLPLNPDVPDVISSMQQDDIQDVFSFDALAYQCDRSKLLGSFFSLAQGVVARDGDALTGFAFLRTSGRGQTIGPVVAASEDVAKALILTLLENVEGFVRFDLTGCAEGVKTWLMDAGLQQVDYVCVMQKGEKSQGDGSRKVFALASQAFG